MAFQKFSYWKNYLKKSGGHLFLKLFSSCIPSKQRKPFQYVRARRQRTIRRTNADYQCINRHLLLEVFRSVRYLYYELGSTRRPSILFRKFSSDISISKRSSSELRTSSSQFGMARRKQPIND